MSNSENSQVDFKQEVSPSGIIFGRFMLPDLSEHACQVIELTKDGAVFLTPAIPERGQAIVAYLEEVGRIEAISGSARTGGFAIEFTMRGARLERLHQRIQWLNERGNGTTADNRRHARFEPSEKTSHITLPDGRVYNCEVLDISVSGAAIRTEVMPSVGTHLMLGKMHGRVVRYLEQGVGIEFVKQLEGSQLPPIERFTI